MGEKFIVAEGQWYLNNIVIFWCQYDVSRYCPGLFACSGVNFPLSIRRSVNKRQAEFLAGRCAAARALAACGIEDYIIGIGEHRSPIWPAGMVGSISHTREFAMSAVQPCTICPYLGLDIETSLSTSMAETLSKVVINERESALIARHPLPADRLLTLFFSAKESLFKALYPSIRHYLNFDSAEVIDCQVADGYLHISVSDSVAYKMCDQRVFTCYFRLDVSHVITLIAEPERVAVTG